MENMVVVEGLVIKVLVVIVTMEKRTPWRVRVCGRAREASCRVWEWRQGVKTRRGGKEWEVVEGSGGGVLTSVCGE